MTLKMIVAGTNANGEPDLFFLRMHCTLEEYNEGEHYEEARRIADIEGYKPPFVPFDENDTAGKALLPLCPWEWETTGDYTV